MTRFQYLALGYSLIWITLGVYLVMLNRRLGRVRGEIAELARRLDSGRGRSDHR